MKQKTRSRGRCLSPWPRSKLRRSHLPRSRSVSPILCLLNSKELICRDIADGLDQNMNPILKKDEEAHGCEREAATWLPQRNVDWRGDAKAIGNVHNRLAAHGQRCGMAAPQGEECHRCKSGRGVFSTCVVNFAGDEILCGGACMNCIFTKEAYRCSLRKCPKSGRCILY